MNDADSFLLKGPKVEQSIPLVPLGEFFLSCFQRHGDKVAQIQQVDGVEVKVTYSDLLRDGKTVTSLLREHGVDVGDTVMLFCGNTVAGFLPVMLGTLFAGATLCPTNSEFDSNDILHLLGIVKPSVIISNKDAEQNLLQALSQCHVSIPVISLESVAERLRDTTGRYDVTHFSLGKVEDPASEVALVMCSSGTSGTPKGVEMTHQFVLQLISGTRDVAKHVQVLLNFTGPYWISCLYATWISCVWGLTTVILNTFREELFFEAIQKYKVNYISLSPHNLVLLAKYGSTDSYDLSSLRVVVFGGSPISPSMLELTEKKLRTRITLVYAMTECVGITTPNFVVSNKPGSVGRPGPNATLKVVDNETGKAVGPNKEGEICVKSPLTFRGYRGNPEASKAMFDEDGFLRTGDVGYYDDDGFLYVMDRIKDLFKYNGFHVNPVDIEDILLQHPQVLQAAVVGVYHEQDCARATAFVVTCQGASVTGQDLLNMVQDRLPNYKWLHGGVHFITDMPRTTTGKIAKKMLRKE